MSWFRIVNAGEKRARLDIYGMIGEFADWWSGEKSGVAARDFSVALQALGEVEEIELHINSPGGSVPDGIQIYNELKRHAAQITGYIDGQAASIASIVAMACDELIMPANTSLWVHDPAAWLDAWGYQNAKELRDTAQKVLNLADDLDTTREQLVNTYLTKTGDTLDRNELVAMMDKETTITAEQAVAWGLADRIEEPLQQTARHDMGRMREAAQKAFEARVAKAKAVDHPPPSPPAAPQPMDARALVALCREAGLPSLAPGMIETSATEEHVRERVALARDVRDLAVASGCDAIRDQLIEAALDGPVAALRLALSVSMEGGEPQIRGDHGLDSKLKARPLNVFQIHDRRKAMRNSI